MSLFDVESQRVDTLCQNIVCLFVSDCYVVYDDFLADEPVIIAFRPSDIRIFARTWIGGFQIFRIFSTIHRFHIEALIRAPYELFVEVCAFQVCCHFFHPFFRRNRRKLVEQLFFTICHSVFVLFFISDLKYNISPVLTKGGPIQPFAIP